jgi:hypothetical protein
LHPVQNQGRINCPPGPQACGTGHR